MELIKTKNLNYFLLTGKIVKLNNTPLYTLYSNEFIIYYNTYMRT